jgi:hypothetical protein
MLNNDSTITFLKWLIPNILNTLHAVYCGSIKYLTVFSRYLRLKGFYNIKHLKEGTFYGENKLV